MITFPNAKINLGLDILCRRPDGYHDISTIMVPVKWADVLELVPAKGSDTTLTVTGRGVDCPIDKNLVMKAYRALAMRVDIPPVDIYLNKIIPDGAGLGGGSSDASFTLTAINDMFSLGISSGELAEIAASIGSDCPFFIYNRPMYCSGTGTRMTPIDLPALDGLNIVIIKPNVSVPTAEAYSRVTPSFPAVPIENIVAMPVKEWQGLLKNDFEPSVFAAHPSIGEIKNQLLELGALYASMSGSGAAVYGIFTADTLSAFRSSPVFAELSSSCDTFIGTV